MSVLPESTNREAVDTTDLVRERIDAFLGRLNDAGGDIRENVRVTRLARRDLCEALAESFPNALSRDDLGLGRDLETSRFLHTFGSASGEFGIQLKKFRTGGDKLLDGQGRAAVESYDMRYAFVPSDMDFNQYFDEVAKDAAQGTVHLKAKALIDYLNLPERHPFRLALELLIKAYREDAYVSYDELARKVFANKYGDLMEHVKESTPGKHPSVVSYLDQFLIGPLQKLCAEFGVYFRKISLYKKSGKFLHLMGHDGLPNISDADKEFILAKLESFIEGKELGNIAELLAKTYHEALDQEDSDGVVSDEFVFNKVKSDLGLDDWKMRNFRDAVVHLSARLHGIGLAVIAVRSRPTSRRIERSKLYLPDKVAMRSDALGVVQSGQKDFNNLINSKWLSEILKLATRITGSEYDAIHGDLVSVGMIFLFQLYNSGKFAGYSDSTIRTFIMRRMFDELNRLRARAGTARRELAMAQSLDESRLIEGVSPFGAPDEIAMVKLDSALLVSQMSTRDTAFVDARVRGYSQVEIAGKNDLTKGRVSQIFSEVRERFEESGY